MSSGAKSTASKVAPAATTAKASPAREASARASSPVAAFQASAGNLAVQAALTGVGHGGAMSLSRPEDPDERHADAMADRFTASAPVRTSVERPTGDGRLPSSMRGEYEAFFGADFSSVRVHTDARAGSVALGLNAKAFAAGNDLYFGAGHFAPETGDGRRLLAHELAHVTQDRSPGRVRRQHLDPNRSDAENDGQLLALLQSQSAYLPINLASQLGGLAGWRQRLPLTYAEIRSRAVTQFGAPAISALESHDAEILALVTKSETVLRSLGESYEYWGNSELPAEEAEAAQGLVRFYGISGDLSGDGGLYEVSYFYFASQYAADIHYDLRLYQQIMAGDAEELVAQVGREAFLNVVDAREARQRREAWTEAGAKLVGRRVAKREDFIFDDSIDIEEQFEPTFGGEDYDDMLAIARLTGRMCAVIKVGDRFYVYGLSENFDRDDIYLVNEWDQRTELVVEGPEPHATAIVTSDGFMVTLERDKVRYFGVYPGRDAMRDLEADTRLLEKGELSLLGDGLPDLFLNMVRNLALVNLQEAEQRMNGVVSQMSADPFGVDTTQGATLKRATARLRELTIESESLADEIGDEAPTEEQGDRRDDLLGEMGELVQRHPAAAFFVKQEEGFLWGTEVVDELEGLGPNDAARRGIGEANQRKENIAKVRRAMFDDPKIVLGFEPLHDPVFERFTEAQRVRIRISLAWRELSDVAGTLGLAALDLALLIGGFVTGGATWVGLGLEAAGTGLAVVQLNEQIRNAALLKAQAKLDVKGGFQLATEEQVASAEKWLVIGAALTFLGAVGLARTAGRLVRAADAEANLIGRIARRAGVSSETVSAALRRSWRGVPNPDPNALRELLLSGLPRELQQRYARLPVRVLDESEWAARFGKDSMEHAATKFISREGHVTASEVLFRRNGNILAMQEEAAHIAQSVDPAIMRQMHDLANVSDVAWTAMSTPQRLRTTRTMLEVELDAQERLLARAQQAGDVEAMDDIFAEMESITYRMGDVDNAIANPAAALPDALDLTRGPSHLFNSPRLPRSKGQWDGLPGNSTWTSNRPAVRQLAPNGVRFRNHYPDFRPWKVYEVRIGQTGHASDFAEADLRMAERFATGVDQCPTGYNPADFMHNGQPIAAGFERYRRAVKMTWHHHQGGNVMLLVPTRLHANVPHTGGASAARAAGP